MREDSRIAVVGGSLTGPLAALLLRRAGYTNVTTFEAVDQARYSRAGGVIGLDHVSLDILDDLGIQQTCIVPFDSERVVAVKMRTDDRVTTLYPGRNTTWSLLHAALTSRLVSQYGRTYRGAYVTGRRITGVDELADGRINLNFSEGPAFAAEFVVFADGRRSTGRRLLDPARTLRYDGYVAHRGQPTGGSFVQALRDFVRYEDAGTQFNVFPVVEVRDGTLHVDWTFYLNESAELFTRHFGAGPTVRTFVLPNQYTSAARGYADEHADHLLTSPLARLVRDTAERMAAPIVDIEAPTRSYWRLGDSFAALVGDALAPVRPHTASGANLGIQQAKGLAVALGQHLRHGADLASALDAWQARSVPAVAAQLVRGRELAGAMALGTYGR